MKHCKAALSVIALLAVAAAVSIVYLYAPGPKQSAGETIELAEAARADLICVRSPQPNEEVSSPLVVEGLARGCWFFEGDFPVTLLDDKGNVLTRSFAGALSEWMTDDLVPFRAQLEFTADAGTGVVLILHKDNPAGLPEHDDRLSLPLVVAGTESLTVKVFFTNSRLDPEISGDKVFAVERRIPRTQAVARRALEELLKGPTDKEAAQDYSTNINTGVRIQRLVIENRTATVDFDEQLNAQVAGACRVSAIRAQITQTLRQFPTVDKVIISINGRNQDVLQP